MKIEILPSTHGTLTPTVTFSAGAGRATLTDWRITRARALRFAAEVEMELSASRERWPVVVNDGDDSVSITIEMTLDTKAERGCAMDMLNRVAKRTGAL